MRIEMHNLDGTGAKRTHVYDMPVVALEIQQRMEPDYWASVTDAPCPCCQDGIIRWAEAGYVPGYRICDGCGRHFLARGDLSAPVLLRVGSRRGRIG